MKRNIFFEILFIAIIILQVNFAHSQTYNQNFEPLFPLDIPMSISGCFGDLRTNALHAGIDFRTEGKTGYNVRATADGYVSRVKIEPGGYGRAVYITHPNGWVSVYAHLEKLNDSIDRYCKTEQYKLMQFRVDLFPPKNSLPLKRGDIIGLSGNAGSSTGPHLHFEIRDEKTQVPVNIAKYFNFPINDTVPPIIEKLWIYPMNENSWVNKNRYKIEIPVKKDNSITSMHTTENITAWGNISFGIEVQDPSEKAFNKTGVYAIKLFEDSSEIFNQIFNRFAFDESRYVNSIIDYEYFQSSYKRINRLFVQPNNKLSVYNKVKNSGIVSITDTLKHNFTIQVFDAFNNSTEIKFSIQSDTSIPSISKNLLTTGDVKTISGKIDQQYKNKNIQIIFQPNSLYENLQFQYNTIPKTNDLFSDIHQIHNKYTPIHQSIIIRITPSNLPDRLKDKAIIAYMNKNRPLWGSGTYKNSYVETYIRTFGDYAITVDTIAPKIIPVFKNKGVPDFKNEKQIAFKITDDLSGINTYQGFVDDKWVLFEYDAKSDLLYYTFDENRLIFGMKHTLKLVITDATNNSSEFSTLFSK